MLYQSLLKFLFMQMLCPKSIQQIVLLVSSIISCEHNHNASILEIRPTLTVFLQLPFATFPAGLVHFLPIVGSSAGDDHGLRVRQWLWLLGKHLILVLANSIEHQRQSEWLQGLRLRSCGMNMKKGALPMLGL